MAKKKSPDTTDPEVEDPEKETKTTDPDQPDDDYEARFKGLQRTFDRRQKEYTTLQDKHDSLLEATETGKQDAREKQTELDALQKETDVAKADLDRVTGELATQETKGKRATLIMSQFSDLAQFEASGLLPQADTEEEMIEKFTAFREALNSTVQANVEQQIVGTSPGETGTTATVPVRDANQIYARLQQLAGSRIPKERAEYDALVIEWDEIQKKK